MRHSYYGKKLSRTKNERKRLLYGLTRSLFLYGKIETTMAKAKAVVPMVEKLITKAKRVKKSDIPKIKQMIPDKDIVQKILTDAQSRFASRQSGFVRITKMGIRRGDASQKVMVSFVDEAIKMAPTKKEKSTVKEQKDDKNVREKKSKKNKIMR